MDRQVFAETRRNASLTSDSPGLSSEGVNRRNVQGSTDLFLPTQNPLDPTAGPIFSVPFTGTTQRMTLP